MCLQPATLLKSRLRWKTKVFSYEWFFWIFSVCDFIKSETPKQAFSCELREAQKKWNSISDLMLMLYFQPATLLKKILRHRCFVSFFSLLFYYKKDSGKDVFLRVLRFFSTCNFIKNEALTQTFSCEFWEIFQPANFY